MEIEKAGYIRKSNFIFLFAAGVYLATLAADYTVLSTQFGKILQLIRYASYGLCIVKILMDSVYRKKETFFYALILVFAGCQSMVSNKRGMVFLLFFLLAGYGVKLGHTLKVQIAVQSVCLLGVWALCFFGVFENLEFYRHGAVTYSLGFNYVGFSGALFFAVQASWLYLRSRKITLAETAGFLLGWVFIYAYTDTRAVCLLGILMTLMGYLLKYRKHSIKNGFMKVLCVAYYPVVTVAVWGLQFYYNGHSQSGLMQKLNSLLSGRLQLNCHAIETYGLKLLGSDINWITNMDNRTRNAYNYVDCTYFKVLFDFGLIVGVLFLLAHAYIMYEMWRQDQLTGIMVMCLFSVLAFMTPIVGLNTNPLLIIAGGIFHGKAEVHQT